MSITSIYRDFAPGVNLVRINSTNTMAQVAVTGYLTAQNDNIVALNNGPFDFLSNDCVLVSASDGHAFFEFTDSDFATLVPVADDNGGVTLPVVDGNFTVFDGTLGGLHDLGYAPSDATKTKVIMAAGAVTINDVLVAADTVGTLKATTSGITAAVNGGLWAKGGAVTSGLQNSFGGTFIANSGNLLGTLQLKVVDNAAAYNIIISNASHTQNSTYTIPNSGQTNANFIVSELVGGTQTIASGNLALTLGYIMQSPVNALTAHVGGGQGSATALTRQINRVTTVASAGDSVKLPAAVAGMVVTVINAAATNAMDCFPQSGEIINALTANTALSIAANKTVTFYCAVNATWNSQVTA